MAKRLIFSAFLLFSVIFLPLYVSFVLAVIGIFYFDLYLEAVGMALIADLLYGVPEVQFHTVEYVCSLTVLVLCAGVEFLKKKLTFYSR